MTKAPFKLIQSLQRAIDIINCFTETDYQLTLNEISSILKLNINTTRGLVKTLVYNGLLSYSHQHGTYSLGLFFLTKSNILQKELEQYILSVKPMIDQLAEKYHTSASLQIVNSKKIHSIYCSYPSNTAYTIGLSEFGSLPLHATSSGKLYSLYNLYLPDKNALKQLDYHKFTVKTITSEKAFAKELLKVKSQGFADESEEFAIGVGSLAVPILDANGKLFSTISATFFASNYPVIKNDLLVDLHKIAKVIFQNLKLSTNSLTLKK